MAVVIFRPSGNRVKFKVVHEQNYEPFLTQGWYLDKEEARKAGEAKPVPAKAAPKKITPRPKPKSKEVKDVSDEK
jgi:hypothetical protein